MADISTGTTNIEFGSVLRIGYRVYGSASAFTYIIHNPTYDELPYTYEIPFTGIFEIEYTRICPNCSGNNYATPILTTVNIS